MYAGIADLSGRALSILIKELEKRGLNLENAARNLYRKNVIKALREERFLLESYNRTPALLEDDIRAFISNMIKVREEHAIRVPSVDVKQLKLAFAKCGPHRIRC